MRAVPDPVARTLRAAGGKNFSRTCGPEAGIVHACGFFSSSGQPNDQSPPEGRGASLTGALSTAAPPSSDRVCWWSWPACWRPGSGMSRRHGESPSCSVPFFSGRWHYTIHSCCQGPRARHTASPGPSVRLLKFSGNSEGHSSHSSGRSMSGQPSSSCSCTACLRLSSSR